MNPDPVKRVMDCVYLFTTPELQAIAQSGPFNSQKELVEKIGKKPTSSSTRKLFSKYGAGLIIDTKKPSLNTLGRAIYDYVKDKQSIQIFDTPKPEQLLELYVSSEFPELFTEISERDSLRNLHYLKKKGVIESKRHRLLESAIRNAILKREGTFRFLSHRAQKFINDVNNVFNLMSYYSASTAFFQSIEEDPHLWANRLLSKDLTSYVKILTILEGIRASLKKIDSFSDDEKIKLKATIQTRIPHLPFARPPVDPHFYVEGKEILKESLDKRRNPDIVLLGLEAYFGSELPQSYYPVALIRVNSGQLISRDGKVPTPGKTVSVVENPKPSGWMDKQTKLLKTLRVETVKKGEASTYFELGKAITEQKADIFSVTAPMNYLAEIYGYKTIVFEPGMKNLEEILFNDAVLLVKKELAVERPEELKTLLNTCKKWYLDYGGALDKPNLKFEHFIGIQESHQLNNYCRKCFGLPNREFRDFIEKKKHNIIFA